jgi:hypothetical protein
MIRIAARDLADDSPRGQAVVVLAGHRKLSVHLDERFLRAAISVVDLPLPLSNRTL